MNYIDSGTSGIVKFVAYAALIVLAAYCADRVYNKKYNDCIEALSESSQDKPSLIKGMCSYNVK